jgi:hypothetical protein
MTPKWLHGYLKKKDSLKETYAHRILGDRLFHGDLWHINRKSLSGGVALGLFVGLTPTMPFHMILVAAGALFLRVNLPVALLVCWINNPLTAPFLYLWEHRLGRFLLNGFEIEVFLSHFDERMRVFYRNLLFLTAGSLLVSSVASLAGSLLVRYSWQMGVALKWKKRNARSIALSVPEDNGENGQDGTGAA